MTLALVIAGALAAGGLAVALLLEARRRGEKAVAADLAAAAEARAAVEAAWETLRPGLERMREAFLAFDTSALELGFARMELAAVRMRMQMRRTAYRIAEAISASAVEVEEAKRRARTLEPEVEESEA